MYVEVYNQVADTRTRVQYVALGNIVERVT